MRAKIARRALAMTGAGALTLAGVIVSASAASAPAWRVVKTFPAAEGVWSENLSVSGAQNAWSTWIACKSCGGSNPVNYFFVEHSAGSGWRRIGVPAPLVASAEASVALGTSSFKDTWLIDPPASPTAATTRVLRWNGSKWLVRAIPAWAVHLNLSGTYEVVPEIFGPRSVWIFSMGVDAFTKPDHYVARFNGRVWTKLQMPAIPVQVSALSPDDIWVLGATAASPQKASTQVLMHWNGRRWRTVALPRVRVPANSTEYVNDPVALGPNDVWIQRQILRGQAGAVTMYLQHWNGRFWRRVAKPQQISIVDNMTQDGHGGLWLAVNGPKPAYRWYIYHLNGGTWTRDSVPAASGTNVLDLIDLRWVPGTRSVFAAGNMLQPGSTGGIIGAILRH